MICVPIIYLEECKIERRGRGRKERERKIGERKRDEREKEGGKRERGKRREVIRISKKGRKE